MNEYVLTEDERGMLDGVSAQIQALQGEAQAILRGIMRLRKLDGNYALADGKLTRQEQK